ncbi:MAG: hypothetical protein SFU99_23715 [Saprospiraceae bacterium]|nr:hypothetical protein [Saprospiraceae bacterium]
MKPIIAFFIFSLLAATALHAQIEDLTKDSEFFEKQKIEYQRWLDHSGLGSTLKVHAIEVKPQQLSLYLAFPYQDIDSIMVAWRTLKSAFEKERPLTLEQELFYKMVHLMEVRQSLANVQIYDTYDLRKEPLFSRAIYFKNDSVNVDASNPKSKIREVNIKPDDFSDMRRMSVQSFNQKFNRKMVYDKIHTYAKQKYERKTCDQRNPQLRLLESDGILRFEIIDLCREVLTDEANPLLCKILRKVGYDCNWVKRELLTFTVIQRETSTGFQLSIEIDGKYGSGFYENVRRGGYLSMEIDFDDYLERYADQFKEEIRRLLTNGKP